MADAASKPATQIVIPTIKKSRLLIPIKGMAPLIMHKWSEKAKREMLDSQQGKKKAKQVRDPEADFKSTIYYTMDGKPGFPSLAFKAATVRGAKLAGVKMTDARQMFSIHGDLADDASQRLCPIIGSEPRMREDMVRVGMGSADLRYRAEFSDWKTVLDITFYPNFISMDSLLSIINFSGETVGVGEWRPEKDGEFGTYEIDSEHEIKEFSA